MEDMYPSITQEDERDILTRFLTWILEDPTAETFILITDDSRIGTRLVEMTTEQEAKSLVQAYLDYDLDQGAKAAEQAHERRMER